MGGKEEDGGVVETDSSFSFSRLVALIPSFVGDMAKPEDFPKALYLSMAAELVLFTITGAVVYSHTGTILTTAPAYGSLIKRYAQPAAAFTLPTIIIVGILCKQNALSLSNLEVVADPPFSSNFQTRSSPREPSSSRSSPRTRSIEGVIL